MSTALSQTNEAISNLDAIALLLVRFRAIEVIYDLSEHPEKMFTASDRIKELHAQLRGQTINLYTQILEYQADLIEHYSHNQMYRMVKSVGLPSGDRFSDIQTTAAGASTTLQTLDSGAIAGVDRQLSSLAESVKEIMDKLVEVNANVLVRIHQLSQSWNVLLADDGQGYPENSTHHRPSPGDLRSV